MMYSFDACEIDPQLLRSWVLIPFTLPAFKSHPLLLGKKIEKVLMHSLRKPHYVIELNKFKHNAKNFGKVQQ